MDRRKLSGQKSLKQQHVGAAARRGPDQDHRSLLQYQRQIEELASENAALREQMANNEFHWEQEKQKILKALRAERKLKSQKYEKKMQKALQEEVKRTQDVNKTCSQEMERVTDEQKEQILRTVETWQKQVEDIKASSDQALMAFNAEWNNRWFVREEEMAAALKTLQEDSEWRVSQVILQQELQEEMKRMEEEMELLTKRNTELQELAAKSDKEKARMKKEERKAKKDAEKALQKQKKEVEEREKKERKENEKKEKEKLKREKKEKEEEEKRLKKETKELREREKKERKEKEKIDKRREE